MSQIPIKKISIKNANRRANGVFIWFAEDKFNTSTRIVGLRVNQNEFSTRDKAVEEVDHQLSQFPALTAFEVKQS